MDETGTIGSLFAGIGGLELALEMCGLGPVRWQAEIDPAARRVLAQHWPKTKRYHDIGGANERPSANTPSLYTIARHWPTPQARDGDQRLAAPSRETAAARFASGRRNLDDAVAMWPTPQAHDAATPKTPEQRAAHIARQKKRKGGGPPGVRNLNEVVADNWPTPTARDAKGEQPNFKRKVGPSLPDAVADQWPTPMAGDAKASGSRNLSGSKAHPGISLTDAVTSGTSTSSRRVRRGSPDGLVLHPQFVEALQGLPSGWTEGGVRKIQQQSGFAFSETA